jgi:hypothetical protein
MDNGTLPTEDAEKAINVVDGKLDYPSAAESGFVEVELPALPGSPNAVERLHARDFGVHVVGKIESSVKRNPYLTKSGPQQSPAQVFRHYVSCAEGSGLLDKASLGRMEQVAAGFEEDPTREYFEEVVRPYLLSLSPQRR